MSYDPAARSHIAAVRTALTTIGKTFPKPVLDALKEHDLIVARGREFAPVSPAVRRGGALLVRPCAAC